MAIGFPCRTLRESAGFLRAKGRALLGCWTSAICPSAMTIRACNMVSASSASSRNSSLDRRLPDPFSSGGPVFIGGDLVPIPEVLRIGMSDFDRHSPLCTLSEASPGCTLPSCISRQINHVNICKCPQILATYFRL